MSKEMRKYIDTFKKFNLKESVTNEYKRDEDDDDSPIIIEGELEYGDYLFYYKVEYHQDFGYQVLEVTSQDIEDVEDFFGEDEYEELLELIYDDVKPKRYKEKEISAEYVAIDTRTGRVLYRSKNQIDRKFVAEWYDIPTTFIKIERRYESNGKFVTILVAKHKGGHNVISVNYWDEERHVKGYMSIPKERDDMDKIQIDPKEAEKKIKELQKEYKVKDKDVIRNY